MDRPAIFFNIETELLSQEQQWGHIVDDPWRSPGQPAQSVGQRRSRRSSRHRSVRPERRPTVAELFDNAG
jgi:hypothetical protein